MLRAFVAENTYLWFIQTWGPTLNVDFEVGIRVGIEDSGDVPATEQKAPLAAAKDLDGWRQLRRRRFGSQSEAGERRQRRRGDGGERERGEGREGAETYDLDQQK